MSGTPLRRYAAALSQNPEVEMTRKRPGSQKMYTVETGTLLELTELKPHEDMLAMGALTAFTESLGTRCSSRTGGLVTITESPGPEESAASDFATGHEERPFRC